MLQEPMMEKLTAMRLLGMVDALKAQEQDPASRELGFIERLCLLVDNQWTWRENQALARRLHSAKLKGASVEDIDYRSPPGARQECDSCLDAEIGLGCQSREHLRARPHRCRQELRGVRPGAQSLPRRLLRTLYAQCCAVPRFGDRAR